MTINYFYITPCVKCGFTHASCAEIRIFTPRDIPEATLPVYSSKLLVAADFKNWFFLTTWLRAATASLNINKTSTHSSDVQKFIKMLSFFVLWHSTNVVKHCLIYSLYSPCFRYIHRVGCSLFWAVLLYCEVLELLVIRSIVMRSRYGCKAFTKYVKLFSVRLYISSTALPPYVVYYCQWSYCFG